MNSQRGATLIEVLGATAIAVAISISVADLIEKSVSDTKGQQAALYQAQVAAAAGKYIRANYDTLIAQATTTTPAPPISLAMFKPQYLSASFSSTNPYGQTPCLVVMKNAAGQLEALLVNEGGTPIPAREIAYVASRSGQGAGYIPAVASGSPPPPEVKSPYGAWAMSNAALAPYIASKCSASSAGAGSLVNSLFYDGPGRLSTEFVYRSAVPGRPELNRMNTPLRIVNRAAVAVENSSDQDCTAGDPNTYGGVSTNAAGEVLSCQAGTWRRQNKYWRDPVASFASLPATGNVTGDVRMVTGSVNRAFAWDGSTWAPLSVDQNGNLIVPNLLKINSTVTYGGACQKGQVSKDANGRLMSCESTTWQYTARPEVLYQDRMDQIVIMKSDYISYPSGTVFFNGTYSYDPTGNLHFADIPRSFVLPRAGNLRLFLSMRMSRQRTTASYDYGSSAKACVYVVIEDNDTLTRVHFDGMCAPLMNNDFAQPSITINKWLPKNASGYTVWLEPSWNLNLGASSDVYNRANRNSSGFVYEMTPITAHWAMDVTS